MEINFEIKNLNGFWVLIAHFIQGLFKDRNGIYIKPRLIANRYIMKLRCLEFDWTCPVLVPVPFKQDVAPLKDMNILILILTVTKYPFLLFVALLRVRVILSVLLVITLLLDGAQLSTPSRKYALCFC